MKIVSDNPELLDKIHKELKLRRIKVKKETKVIDGAMAGGITTALELLTLLKEHYDAIGWYVGGVIATGKYLKSTIKVELQDGTYISWEAYEKMSDEALSKVFSQ